MFAWRHCGGGFDFVSSRHQVNRTIASLLYLTVVVLLSVTDAVVVSIFVSVITVLFRCDIRRQISNAVAMKTISAIESTGFRNSKENRVHCERLIDLGR